jgi:hypothetical protein
MLVMKRMRLNEFKNMGSKRKVVWVVAGGVLIVGAGSGIWLAYQRGALSGSWQELQALQQSPAWNWIVALGFVALAVTGVVVLWKVPHWQVRRAKDLVPRDRIDLDRVNDARKTLAQIFVGFMLIACFLGIWQNLKVAQEAASTSRRALAAAQQGHITDRFDKAVEQLGAVDSKGQKNLEVRLGGIYALGGIANEFKELQGPITEVLSTYVRMNAPRKPQESNQKNNASIALPHPDADIQAILTVLGRRDRKYENGNQHLDLRKIDIQGADLRGADLSGADLSRANVDGADLFRANLSGAHLNEADLSGAVISEARLTGAYFIGTQLSGADLSRADLSRADLRGADLRGADLQGAHLNEADLQGALLNEADLRGSQGLTQEQADRAKGNGTTQLPENLHMPESWGKK